LYQNLLKKTFFEPCKVLKPYFERINVAFPLILAKKKEKKKTYGQNQKLWFVFNFKCPVNKHY